MLLRLIASGVVGASRASFRHAQCEAGPINLTLEHLNLVAERQDLGLAPIAAGQQQTQASDPQTQQAR